MGLLSSIGKVVSKVTGALGVNPVSTALDVAGGFLTDSRSRKAASTAFDRTLDASNTSYQRATADMRAAGLNPILAYSQGGASVPNAPVAGVSDYSSTGTRGVNTALAVKQAGANYLDTMERVQSQMISQRLTEEQTVRQRLENQGLRALPPAVRAAVTMGSATAAGAGALMHGVKAIKSIKKGK